MNDRIQLRRSFELGSAWLLYPLLLGAIGLDIWGYFYFGWRLIQTVLALFATTISRRFTLFRVCMVCMVLATESFFYYGVWGYEAPLLVIVTCAAYWTWPLCTNKAYHAICVIICVLAAQIFCLDWCRGTMPFSVFTLMTFLFNIILTVSISLKYD